MINIRYLIKYSTLILVVSLLAGLSSAFFLYTLDIVTNFRTGNPWIICLLPLGGLICVCSYNLLCRDAESGNKWVLARIKNQSGKPSSILMGRMVLMGT